MKKVIGIACLVLLVAVSCKEGKKSETVEDVPSIEELTTGIVELEDSLMNMSVDTNVRKQLPNLTRYTLIERLLLLYRSYPETKEAAESLDKVHKSYSALGIHQLASDYGDTLLEKYPKYEGRMQVIESIAVNYDVFIQPRKKEKVRKYYQMMLDEYPDLSTTTKESIEFRIKHIDLTFDELIELQMSQEQ